MFTNVISWSTLELKYLTFVKRARDWRLSKCNAAIGDCGNLNERVVKRKLTHEEVIEKIGALWKNLIEREELRLKSSLGS